MTCCEADMTLVGIICRVTSVKRIEEPENDIINLVG